MNPFRRFFSNSTRVLAAQMADALSNKLPQSKVDNRLHTLSVNSTARLLDRVFEVARDYQRARCPGFFGRALIANNFKWELKNRGYPEEFIEMATETLVLELTKVSQRR